MFGGVLGSGRHLGGLPELVGAILRNYRSKPSRTEPVPSNVHDFPPNVAFSNLHSLNICYREGIYLLYENQIVSSAERLEGLLQGGRASTT